VNQETKSFRLSGILRSLGPGLIFAGTSIGVSHIVQSTRAGADYGFTLIWAVVLANIFKFPFFEYGPRYVAATGEHLLVGYRRTGKWAFYLFLTLSLILMFPILAAVTTVTTGLFVNLFHWTGSPVILSAIILFVCSSILLIGKYPLLDKSMKVMILILSISTIIAFTAAVNHGSSAQPGLAKPFVWDLTGISFLVALMGWMPSTIDLSVWHSFWCVERRKQTHYAPSIKEALFDFHLGYWGTAVMAVLFLSLGALVMHGTGEHFSNSAGQFAGQVVSLYTKALGGWSYPVIVAAATITMFSTTLSCLDAFPRIVKEAFAIIFPSKKQWTDKIYFGWMMLVAGVSLLIIGRFTGSMKTLIDIATTLSFLVAPILAYINYRTVTDDHMPEEARPSKGLRIFSWMGIFFLAGFSALFIIWRFFLPH